MTNSAEISRCGKYRWRLDRDVNCGETVGLFIGCNPSTADAFEDDATVRKWNGFARKLKLKKYIVINLFAYRATDVKELQNANDVFGHGFERYYLNAITEADIIIPCWGSRHKIPQRFNSYINDTIRFLSFLTKPVYVFGLTKSGDPKHPLMLPYTTPLVDLRTTELFKL